MDLTIRELSVRLNISKEAIYRKINYTMSDELKECVHKEHGKTYVDDIGQALILKSLNKEQKEINNKVNNCGESESLEYTAFLKDEINLLIMEYTKEIENKERTIQSLLQINQSLIESLQNEQKLNASNLLIENKTKMGFFKRFFFK